MPRQGFIKSISAETIQACSGMHLFPSLMIAQACLESADGQSVLSAKYHNYFGMKPGGTWKGPTVNMETTEYEHGKPVKIPQPFRVYASVGECITNHIQMLQRVSVYTTAGLFKAATPELQAKCLLKAGYATDPHYPSKLIAIINENNLKQYDNAA